MSCHEIQIIQTISAAHAIKIGNAIEPIHGHDFTFTVRIRAKDLNHDGLVFDFHELKKLLNSILVPFKNKNFNEIPPFNKENPTAEKIAQYVGTQLISKISDEILLSWISVTEAEGCTAYWLPSS